MLFTVASHQAYKLRTLDGDIGEVQEFYFDEQCWTIRYVVAATGTWLRDRQVLISPHALTSVAGERREISVALTKRQIETGPLLTRDTQVSHGFEKSYFEFFGWPAYWSGPHQWGAHRHIVRTRERRRPAMQRAQGWMPRLRSISDVNGHHIQAPDGEIGSIAGFLIDDETWEIRYVIVARRSWWSETKVLLAPEWIERVSWDKAEVHVALSRRDVRRSPAYSANTPLTREDEIRLHHHYRRTGYWDNDRALAAHDG